MRAEPLQMAEPDSNVEKIAAQQQYIVQSQKWSWSRLRRGRAHPIPSERQVSKEYGAGFWSKLTFSWMNEHMSVRTISALCSLTLIDPHRLDIIDHWNMRISGW